MLNSLIKCNTTFILYIFSFQSGIVKHKFQIIFFGAYFVEKFEKSIVFTRCILITLKHRVFLFYVAYPFRVYPHKINK